MKKRNTLLRGGTVDFFFLSWFDFFLKFYSRVHFV